MKKISRREKEPEMLKEYDFSKGVRGKYAERFREGYEVIVDPIMPSKCTTGPKRVAARKRIKKTLL
jgi:hypothetical protein